MGRHLRWLVGAALGLLLAALAHVPALAFVDTAQQLSFNPEQDYATRYMFTLAMSGVFVGPGVKDEVRIPEFLIGTVYKDTVVESLYNVNRHAITFYEYAVRALQTPLGQDRVDPRFGGSPWPPIGGGEAGGGGGGEGGGGGGGGEGGGGGGGEGGGGGDGGPPGGGGGGPAPTPSGSFLGGLQLPQAGPRVPSASPLQGGGGPPGDGGGGGGGGGVAGEITTPINLDTILVTNLNYLCTSRGEVLDIGGLDLLRKVSRNRILENDDKSRGYIDINISHVFEWTHLLYLPDYPVYKENYWFHSAPLHIPGLPDDQPVMTKFMYKLVDFRNIGDRKVAVIDMNGIAEWNLEWEEKLNDELTEFKSWGSMGVASRYWFDYENGVIFGIERPPMVDWQYLKADQGLAVDLPYAPPVFPFQLRFPGLIVNMEFFYNTRVTDISGKPRLTEVEPKESRRYVLLNMLCQLEAE